jgi:hypothetical protein
VADTEAVHDALVRATERRAERSRLATRLESLRAAVDEAARSAATARTGLAEEERDVAKLESFSATRIWASLRDTRLSDLDRERAERDAAAYAVAEAEGRRAALQRDADALEAELATYASADDDHVAALVAKDTWVRENGAPGAEELAAIAEELGTLLARDKELMEAGRAAVEARRLLAEAEDRLRRARDWSNWDAFGGGGFFTDMMKYDRIDEAVGTLRAADRALKALSRELADVGMRVAASVNVRSVNVRGLDQAFDVWFDNIFSDLSVRSRVVDAHDTVRRVLAELVAMMSPLRADIDAGTARLAELNRRREELLTNG